MGRNRRREGKGAASPWEYPSVRNFNSRATLSGLFCVDWDFYRAGLGYFRWEKSPRRPGTFEIRLSSIRSFQYWTLDITILTMYGPAAFSFFNMFFGTFLPWFWFLGVAVRVDSSGEDRRA